MIALIIVLLIILIFARDLLVPILVIAVVVWLLSSYKYGAEDRPLVTEI
jgi:hypothetical protein